MASSSKKRSSRAKSSSRSSASSDIDALFGEPLRNYVGTLGNVLENGQEELRQAYLDSVRGVEQLQAEGVRVRDEANRGFIAEVQEAFGEDDAERQVSGSHQKHAQALADQLRELAARQEETVRGHLAGQAEALAKTREHCRQARASYLKELQSGWAKLDTDAVDAATLAAIGRTLLTAAAYAAATTEPNA